MKQKLLIKVMLLLCALVAGSSSVWAGDVTVSWTASSGGLGTGIGSGTITDTGSNSWSYTRTLKSGESYTGWTSNCIQLGKNGGVENLTLSTTAYNSKVIKSVSVECSSYQGGHNVSISVGGTTYLASTATASWTTVSTKTGTGTSSGTIQISFTGGTRALYIKSISVTYEDEGGGSDPSISLGTTSVSAPETAVSTTTINVTYSNLTNYDADVIFYEANGTDAATYDHSWITAEINASTKNLDYSITANTGAARTAYLRVYALGDEGEAESALITVTQAKKSVASPEFDLNTGSYMQGTKITITSEGNTIYYTTTTDGTEPTAPTTNSTEYTAPIAIPSGSFRIKAIAFDTYGNKSNPTQRTYTGIAPASLPFSWTGTSSAGKAQLAEETGVVVNLGSDYATSNAPYRLKFDGEGKYVIIYTDARPENVYFTAKLLGGKADTGTKMKVQGSADGLTFTDIEEFTIKGASNATFEFTTSNAFAATHRAVKLVLSSLDKNVGVGTICVSCLPIKPAKTYTTLTSAYNLDFTGLSGLKAYIATEVNAGNVLMTQVNKVPANTGLVLKATTPGSAVNVPVFDGTGADDVSANKMAGSATATTTVAENAGYILKDGVFHPSSGANALPAGKAYLNIAVSAPTLILNFDDATGVNEVRGQKEDIRGEVYDLQGRRVAQPTKGLYIVNGKKVVIK